MCNKNHPAPVKATIAEKLKENSALYHGGSLVMLTLSPEQSFVGFKTQNKD